MWGLAVWDRIGGLLQTDNLSVGKFASVVYEGHGADRGADIARAALGLVYLAPVDLNLDRVVAGEATEERHLHVWYHGGGANNQSLDTDKLIRIYNIAISESLQQKSKCSPPGLRLRMLTEGRPKGRTLYTSAPISRKSSRASASV